MKRVGSNVTSLTLGNLQPNTEYSISVTAETITGSGPMSENIVLTTDYGGGTSVTNN